MFWFSKTKQKLKLQHGKKPNSYYRELIGTNYDYIDTYDEEVQATLDNFQSSFDTLVLTEHNLHIEGNLDIKFWTANRWYGAKLVVNKIDYRMSFPMCVRLIDLVETVEKKQLREAINMVEDTLFYVDGKGIPLNIVKEVVRKNLPMYLV